MLRKLETQQQNAVTGTADKSLSEWERRWQGFIGGPESGRGKRGSVMDEGEIRDCRGKCPTGEGEIRQERGNE